MSGVSDISVGHIEPDDGKARPGLLDKVEKPSGATADIQKPQLALIASGKEVMELRQGLPPHRIGGAVEQDLDLGVIALSRLIRQPAAGLIVEILQIVARPGAARVFIENLAVGPPVAAAMDCRQIREEQSRTIDERQQLSIMIEGQGINAGHDIGEVLQE